MLSLKAFFVLVIHLGAVGYLVFIGKYIMACICHFLVLRTLTNAPMLLHSLKTKMKPVVKNSQMSNVLVGHRGGSAESPENTLHSFKHALKQGC